MKEILIDFMVWFDSIPTEEVLCDHEVLIDKYLKSINCPMEKPRTLGENEDEKKPCDCTITCRYGINGANKYKCRSVD